MSKRTQLIIALSALFIVALLLGVLLISVLARGDSGLALVAEPPPAWTESDTEGPVDPWANLDVSALAKVWTQPSTALPTEDDQTTWTIRQVVETDLLSDSFPNLRWNRIERIIGWRAFQQEGSVYEVQFVLQDGAVEFGPAWIVQLNPVGLQPEGSDGVVPANVFAEVVQHGASEELERFLNRETEVVEALTNHAFGLGARMAAAILVYFRTNQRHSEDCHLIGWTVIPERIIPDQETFYRAAFLWEEAGVSRFAQWEINLDTQAFRPLNLLASDVMASGDQIDPEGLDDIRPNNFPEDEDDLQRNQRAAYRAVRTIVNNDRLLEAVSSLLWAKTRRGAQVEYQAWDGDPSDGHPGSFDVIYRYLEDEEPQQVGWRVDGDEGTVQPLDDLARLAYVAVAYVEVPEIVPEDIAEGSGDVPVDEDDPDE